MKKKKKINIQCYLKIATMPQPPAASATPPLTVPTAEEGQIVILVIIVCRHHCCCLSGFIQCESRQCSENWQHR
jgi:hypothetical protein